MSQVRGSGKRVVEKRQIPAFTSIETNGAFTIAITCQKEPSLEVEGDDNVLQLVSTEVKNNVLHLKSSKGYSTSEPVKFRITVPNLEGLTVSGAGKVDIKEMKSDTFAIDSEGAPYITVAGDTKILKVDSNGAGKIDTYNLRASKGTVECNGATIVDLFVADELDVKVNGPSTVTYKGDPVVNKNINGPGRVERRASQGA
ncbi:MAG TPA: head GIN domain-containing protein [Pyrinomonadaceae bacterium]|nr:head GIN domain-containing protein [Pyrinomonadaceae bacterium]